MKVRLDFVTNSSSTSSAIALGSSLLGILGGLGLASCQCGEPGEDPGGSRGGGGGGGDDPAAAQAAIDAALQASQQAGQDAADKVAADAAAKDQLINAVLGSENDKLEATAAKIKAEMDQYNQQWQDAQQGLDPKDPGFADFKKKYDDYQDYLKSQLEQVNAQQFEIKAAQAQEQIAQESKNSWVKQQQEDLVQVMEQKSFLEAVAKGYGANKDYDISKVQSQLDQLAQREGALRNTLKDNKAEIDYTPRDRQPIGPDPELARINSEYKKKMADLQAQADDQKAIRTQADRDALAAKMKRLEADAQTQASRASFWNVMTKAAETTQVVSDISIDVLSNVTGPYGKTVKTCYTGLKGLAGGVGEGLANGKMSQNIVKGGLSGLSDIAKDKIGDKFGKAAQGIYTIGSEAGKSAVESVLDGKTSAKDLVKAGLTGATKGTLDVVTGAVTDKLLPGKDLPSGLDWSSINAKTFVNSVKASNPLTVQNIGRDAIGNGIKSAVGDQVKNLVKGENVIYSGLKQNATDNIIDTGTSLAAPKYTPYVVKGVDLVGGAVKSTASSIANMVNNAGSLANNTVY